MSDIGAPRSRNWSATTALLFLLGLAAVLRVVGLSWGLPGPTHLFSYHPDEYFSLSATLRLAIGDPDPGFFNYPSFYLYLVAGAASLAGHLTALGTALDAGNLPELPALLRALTVDARVVTVLLSVATVFVVYAMGARLAGRRAGVLAAAILAVAPGHVLYSHFATVDVPLALFTTLSLYLALTLLDDPRPGTAALAGLVVAAAAATKYNGAVALVMPLAALGVRVIAGRRLAADGQQATDGTAVRVCPSTALRAGTKARSAAVQAAIVVAVALVGFAVFSPYVVLDWSKATHDIAFEMGHMRAGEYPAKAADPNGWLFQLRALGYATGGAAPLAAAIGLFAWGARRQWRRMLPAVLLAVLWFGMIGATGVRYARYGLPLLPVVALGAGIGVAELARAGRRTLRGLSIAGGVATIALPLATSGLLIWSLAAEVEPRDSALAAVQAQVPAGATIGLTGPVWFEGPPLDYDNGGAALGSLPLWQPFHRASYRLEVTGLDAAALGRKRAPWFVESDFQTADWLRARDPGALAFGAALERDYRLEQVFRRRGGWALSGSCGPPPHDWSYPFTTIRLWKVR